MYLTWVSLGVLFTQGLVNQIGEIGSVQKTLTLTQLLAIYYEYQKIFFKRENLLSRESKVVSDFRALGENQF